MSTWEAPTKALTKPSLPIPNSFRWWQCDGVGWLLLGKKTKKHTYNQWRRSWCRESFCSSHIVMFYLLPCSPFSPKMTHSCCQFQSCGFRLTLWIYTEPPHGPKFKPQLDYLQAKEEEFWVAAWGSKAALPNRKRKTKRPKPFLAALVSFIYQVMVFQAMCLVWFDVSVHIVCGNRFTLRRVTRSTVSYVGGKRQKRKEQVWTFHSLENTSVTPVSWLVPTKFKVDMEFDRHLLATDKLCKQTSCRLQEE